MTIHFSGIHLSEESKKIIDEKNPQFFSVLNETINSLAKKMIINECGALIQICEKEKIMINNVYATTEKIIEKITS